MAYVIAHWPIPISLERRLAVHIARSQQKHSACRDGVGEPALGSAVQGDGHWIARRVEDIDASSSDRTAIVDERDLRGPTTSHGKLRAPPPPPPPPHPPPP